MFTKNIKWRRLLGSNYWTIVVTVLCFKCMSYSASNTFMDETARIFIKPIRIQPGPHCAVQRAHGVRRPPSVCTVVHGRRAASATRRWCPWPGEVSDRACSAPGKETTASLTNAKAAFCVTGAELKSGFQTTFEENNGHVYFTNVCSLGGENVLSSCWKPFHRSRLLWWRNGAAVEKICKGKTKIQVLMLTACLISLIYGSLKTWRGS